MKVTLFILLILTIIFGTLYKLEVFSSDQINLKIKTTDSKEEFNVWLAQTDEEKIRGLAGKFRIKDNEGMLFVLNEKQIGDFWMKDVRFKIDLLFIDYNNRVSEIHEQLEPCQTGVICPVFTSREPTKYALEIKGSQAKKRNIKIGDEVETDVIAW